MKKILAVVLVVCGVIIGGVFVAGFLEKKDAQSNDTTATNKTITASDAAEDPSTVDPNTQESFSLADVQKHTTKSDCWIIVSNKVYDVTKYINSHPGGANEILRNCGKDATSDFNSQGGEGSHSSSATSMLKSFMIGNLKQ